MIKILIKDLKKNITGIQLKSGGSYFPEMVCESDENIQRHYSYTCEYLRTLLK